MNIHPLPATRKYRKHLFLLVSGYFLTLLAIVGLPFWPIQAWAFAALLNFAPHWLFIVPPLVLMPLCLATRQYGLVVVLIGALVLCGKLSGWVLNVDAVQANDHPSDSLTATGDPLVNSKDSLVVITANMGFASYETLNQLIVESNADLIALQEVSESKLLPLLNMSPLNSVCVGELCLLSHLNLKLVKAKNRALLQNQGEFAMQVEVGLPPSETQTSFKSFDFFVVHLKTPRTGFQALIANPLSGWPTFFEVIDNLMTESWITSNWVAQGHNPIVAGDFNLPRDNPIFVKYWRWLSDSFQESGNGLGYSKHTRWHGVQIDHILHSQEWSSQKTWIGPSLAGDHSPVITILNRR